MMPSLCNISYIVYWNGLIYKIQDLWWMSSDVIQPLGLRPSGYITSLDTHHRSYILYIRPTSILYNIHIRQIAGASKQSQDLQARYTRLQEKPLLEIVQKQKQIGSHDCGLFAIATAIAVLFGHDAASIHFSQRTMRNHYSY